MNDETHDDADGFDIDYDLRMQLPEDLSDRLRLHQEEPIAHEMIRKHAEMNGLTIEQVIYGDTTVVEVGAPRLGYQEFESASRAQQTLNDALNRISDHTEDCPNQPGVGYVCAPIPCPECDTHGWHPTRVCNECGYATCWCVEGDQEGDQ